jgi:uncharacterized protein (DUF2141 family)
MKTTIKFILSIMLIAISIVISRCATVEEPKEIQADTISRCDSQKTTADTIACSKKTVTGTIAKRTPLTLIINNLASPTAPVIVGIYKSKYKFLYKESRLKEYKFTPKGKTLTVQITDINYGEIAIAVYEDMNSNGEFDKNFIGLPAEGYCFSNNFRPTVKGPDYDDCKFNYDSTTDAVTMHLIK